MLLISCTGLFAAGLDVTIVNVALPSIASSLHSSLSGLQWTADAYSLVMAGLMMLFGSTGDRWGRKRMLVAGLAVFSAGSLASSLAPGVAALVAFRAVQAVGGAMLNPVAVSIITNTFTDPRERAQAVGVRGAIYGISLALGPVLGGVLVSATGWRSVFWVNVPIGAIAILLAVRYIPESRAPRPRRFDPVGQVLVAVLLVTLTYGIIEGPGQGWASPSVISCFAAAAVSAAGLVRSESRRSEPLIDLRFFRSVPFSAASAIAVLAFGAFGGALFLNTLYLQDVRLLPPLHAGLETLPLAVMVMAGSLASGRMVASRGPRPALIASGVSGVTGCAVLAGMTGTTAYPQLLAGYILFGFGFGLVNTPVTNTAVSGMPRAQAGVASAIASSSRQLGQTLGVAVAGAILAGSAGGPPHAGFIPASHAAWRALTACSGLVLLLGFLATTRRAVESARQSRPPSTPKR